MAKNGAQRISMKPAFLDAYKDFMKEVNTYNAGAEHGVPRVYVNASYDGKEGTIKDGDNGPYLILDFADSRSDNASKATILINPPMLGRTPTSLRFVNSTANGAYPVKGITTLYNGRAEDPAKDMDVLVDTSLAINQMSYTPLFDAEQDLCGENQLNRLARQDANAPAKDHGVKDYARRIAQIGNFGDSLEILRELYDEDMKFDNTAEESFKSMLRFAAYSKALDHLYENGHDNVDKADIKALNEACGIDFDTDSLTSSAKKVLGLDELENGIKNLAESLAKGSFDVSELGKSATLGLCSLGVYKSIMACTASLDNPMLDPTQYANLGCAVSMNNKEIDVAREKQSICNFIGCEVETTDGSMTKVWPADKACYPKYICLSAETGRKFGDVDFDKVSNASSNAGLNEEEAQIRKEAMGVRVDDDELYRICAASKPMRSNGSWKFSIRQDPYKPLNIPEGVLRFEPVDGMSTNLDDAIQPKNIDLNCFKIITKDGRNLPLCQGNTLCVENFEGFPMMEQLGDNDVDVLAKAVRNAFISASKYKGEPVGHSMEIDLAGLDFQVFKQMYEPSDKKNMKMATMIGNMDLMSIGVAKLKRSSYKQAPLAVMHIAGTPSASLGSMAFGWLSEKAMADTAVELGKIDACDVYDVDNKIRRCENLMMCASEVEKDENRKNCGSYKAYMAFKSGMNKYMAECDSCDEMRKSEEYSNIYKARMLFKKSDSMDQDTRMDKVAEILTKIPGSYGAFSVDEDSQCVYDADKKSFVINKGFETECVVERGDVKKAMIDACISIPKKYYESKAKLNDFLVMMDTYRFTTDTGINALMDDIDSAYDIGDKKQAPSIGHLYRPQNGFEVAVIKHLVTEQGVDPDKYFKVGPGFDYNKAVSTAISNEGATQALIEDAKRAVMSRATAMDDNNARFIVQMCKDVDAYQGELEARQDDSYVMDATKAVFAQAKQQSDDEAKGDEIKTPGE